MPKNKNKDNSQARFSYNDFVIKLTDFALNNGLDIQNELSEEIYWELIHGHKKEQAAKDLDNFVKKNFDLEISTEFNKNKYDDLSPKFRNITLEKQQEKQRLNEAFQNDVVNNLTPLELEFSPQEIEMIKSRYIILSDAKSGDIEANKQKFINYLEATIAEKDPNKSYFIGINDAEHKFEFTEVPKKHFDLLKRLNDKTIEKTGTDRMEEWKGEYFEIKKAADYLEHFDEVKIFNEILAGAEGIESNDNLHGAISNSIEVADFSKGGSYRGEIGSEDNKFSDFIEDKTISYNAELYFEVNDKSTFFQRHPEGFRNGPFKISSYAKFDGYTEVNKSNGEISFNCFGVIKINRTGISSHEEMPEKISLKSSNAITFSGYDKNKYYGVYLAEFNNIDSPEVLFNYSTTSAKIDSDIFISKFSKANGLVDSTIIHSKIAIKRIKDPKDNEYKDTYVGNSINIGKVGKLFIEDGKELKFNIENAQIGDTHVVAEHASRFMDNKFGKVVRYEDDLDVNGEVVVKALDKLKAAAELAIDKVQNPKKYAEAQKAIASASPAQPQLESGEVTTPAKSKKIQQNKE